MWTSWLCSWTPRNGSYKLSSPTQTSSSPVGRISSCTRHPRVILCTLSSCPAQRWPCHPQFAIERRRQRTSVDWASLATNLFADRPSQRQLLNHLRLTPQRISHALCGRRQYFHDCHGASSLLNSYSANGPSRSFFTSKLRIFSWKPSHQSSFKNSLFICPSSWLLRTDLRLQTLPLSANPCQ